MAEPGHGHQQGNGNDGPHETAHAPLPSAGADRKMNLVVAVTSLVLLAGAWVAIRQQLAISDTQFLRAMIPHHSSAILMCERTTLTDPELIKLCGTIVAGQQAEIDQMNAALRRLSN